MVERDGVDEALLRIGESYLQLTTGTRPDSAITTFLAKRGRASITSATGWTTG
ncbi:MAG: hypothetical protein Ct9H300mP12_08140 [Acidimicrobiales bacterium]|nr:MAG: hypothetical protein Ct9H300mP12_08140 [Acidimicrobiales bacterium]